ncbi:hypothetical protein BaRGS_00016089 [Batillaria attramentaria]|uniref:Uncharacterized protein n=1 Tax=Batillaria attramentaria TaxID=370345 RepID=A0ABD0L0G3_9CAEN
MEQHLSKTHAVLPHQQAAPALQQSRTPAPLKRYAAPSPAAEDLPLDAKMRFTLHKSYGLSLRKLEEILYRRCQTCEFKISENVSEDSAKGFFFSFPNCETYL